MTSTSPPTSSQTARTLDEALALLAKVTVPEDLFPDDSEQAARRFRRLARLLHPDAVPASRKAEAQAAFTILAKLWERHRKPGGTGGRPTVTTRRNVYVLGATLTTGDLAVLRETDGEVLLKIPKRPADNDLMEREARALARLDAEGDPKHRAYAPHLVETFRHRETGAPGVERRVNALGRLRGFHTLAEVRAVHPDGLDPRDAAWMWRRLLVALGWAHRAGVMHGAVLPEHVLIHPEQHGVVLVDWCYSVIPEAEPEGNVPALVERYRDWYPPEVLRRDAATQATDIHLASKCMEHLMGACAPKALRAFIRGCTLPAEPRRPHDAWRLLAELDEALERLYGRRKFRPFTMPG